MTGFVVDLKWLKDVMENEVLAAYDHRHLNLEVPEFADGKLIPTTENIAIAAWKRLEPAVNTAWRSTAESGTGLRDAGDLCRISGTTLMHERILRPPIHVERQPPAAFRRAFGRGESARPTASATTRMVTGTTMLLRCWWAGQSTPIRVWWSIMAALDEVVQTSVLERFDHTNLNFDPLFANQVPTTENLCKAVFQLLKDALPAGQLEYVRVEETENNFFRVLR